MFSATAVAALAIVKYWPATLVRFRVVPSGSFTDAAEMVEPAPDPTMQPPMPPPPK